jgi:hypothetical protein
VNQRARDLGVIMEGALRSVGPGARGLSVYEPLASQMVIRVTAATDDELAVIAVNYELEVLGTESRGNMWWRQASSREGRLHIVAVGPYYHPGSLLGLARKP